MINCQICEHNPTGERCEYFGRVIGMHGCSSGVERKPRNNFERLKAMSMEEMANYFDEVLLKAPFCNPERACKCEDFCVPCILRWLKEEIADA